MENGRKGKGYKEWRDKMGDGLRAVGGGRLSGGIVPAREKLLATLTRNEKNNSQRSVDRFALHTTQLGPSVYFTEQ